MLNVPVNIVYKSIAGRYRPVRVADGPITTSYRFIKNASWGVTSVAIAFRLSILSCLYIVIMAVLGNFTYISGRSFCQRGSVL